MKTLFSYPMAICFAVTAFLFSCKKDVSSPGAGGAGENTLSGTIYDAVGNKFNIPNAKVMVHAIGNVGSIGDDDPAYNFPMDANSRYAGTVENGVYGLHARAYMQLNGNKVCIDLEPTDGKPEYVTQPSKPGIVKDFKLMLTGLAAGGNANNIEDYYGAHVYFTDGAYNFTSEGYWNNLASAYPNSKVVFNFAIESPLLDGSQGQSQRVEAPVESLKNGQWFINIPFAAYRLTAFVVMPNGSQIPLKLNNVGYNASDLNSHYNYIDLTFPPNPDDMDGHPIEPEVAVWVN